MRPSFTLPLEQSHLMLMSLFLVTSQQSPQSPSLPAAPLICHFNCSTHNGIQSQLYVTPRRFLLIVSLVISLPPHNACSFICWLGYSLITLLCATIGEYCCLLCIFFEDWCPILTNSSSLIPPPLLATIHSTGI